MRHATKQAVAALAGALKLPIGNRRACDGKRIASGDPINGAAFGLRDAVGLLAGYAVTLPDCPRCAVLLDQELEGRRL